MLLLFIRRNISKNFLYARNKPAKNNIKPLIIVKEKTEQLPGKFLPHSLFCKERRRTATIYNMVYQGKGWASKGLPQACKMLYIRTALRTCCERGRNALRARAQHARSKDATRRALSPWGLPIPTRFTQQRERAFKTYLLTIAEVKTM